MASATCGGMGDGRGWGEAMERTRGTAVCESRRRLGSVICAAGAGASEVDEDAPAEAEVEVRWSMRKMMSLHQAILVDGSLEGFCIDERA
jgi:hypothetical protein